MPRVLPEYSLEYKEEAKRKIVDAGLHVLAEKGYHKTTMDDVADRLGISKGTLYLYFKSREELFRAIVEGHQGRVGEVLKKIFSGGKLPDFTNIPEDQSLSREEFMHLWIELLSESTRDEWIRETIADNIEKRIQMIREILEEQTRKGAINAKGDLRSKSIATLAVLMGIIFLRILKFDESELNQISRKSLDAILATA